jgi:isopenicillin-N N-acyltransferase like protein
MLLLACTLGACASAMPPFQAGSTAHGKLGKSGEHWVLELDGSPEERGKAAGALVGPQVRWLLSAYLKKLLGTDRLSPTQKEAVAAIASEVPAPHFAELNALAEAAQVDRTALFAANLAPEMASSLACSCLATLPERSGDGAIRLARNLDWPGGSILAGAELVVIESGTSHRFASFTWPGLLGVATGMNDAGLSVADLMALGTGGHPRPGIPVLFAVRSMLEKAGTVDEALAWLKSAARTMPQNYALADATTARVVETGNVHFRMRDATVGLAAITNYWREDAGGAKDGRYAGMLKAAGERKLGVSDLQAILSESALGHGLNLQAVVLEPAGRKALVAKGKPPVARGTWYSLDLSPWLGAQPR